MGLKITITVEGGHESTEFRFGAEHYAPHLDDPRYFVSEFTTGTAKLVGDLSGLLASMTPESQLP